MSSPFYGKYRGLVTDVKDPLMIGRIRAKVPDITGDKEIGWAMPCFPMTGGGMGFFALPMEGTGVWIEFEQGDPDYPIWSGCWWGAMADLPPVLLQPPYKKIMVKSEAGNSVLLDDTPGVGGIQLETADGHKVSMSGAEGIKIETSSGQKISLSPSGIELETADGHKISMTATDGIKLETSSGQKLALSPSGIELDNGMGGAAKLEGPKVSINGGALEVM